MIEQQIAEILLFVAESERNIETLRKELTASPNFSHMSLYNFLARSISGITR